MLLHVRLSSCWRKEADLQGSGDWAAGRPGPCLAASAPGLPPLLDLGCGTWCFWPVFPCVIGLKPCPCVHTGRTVFVQAWCDGGVLFQHRHWGSVAAEARGPVVVVLCLVQQPGFSGSVTAGLGRDPCTGSTGVLADLSPGGNRWEGAQMVSPGACLGSR